MSQDEIQVNAGMTVNEAKTEKFIDLVEDGKDPKDAARDCGLTLNSLRKSGVLTKAAMALLKRVEAEKLLDKKTYEMLARARNVELMMQDEDLKVALGAVRIAVGTGPQVAVQINNNVKTPEVIESLKSLQLEIDEDGE